jgi:TolA-binding protein
MLPVLVLTISFFCLLPARAGAMTADEAEKLSRESGRPMLIVAGRHTCGLTQAVLKRLEEPALTPLVSQFVYVFINVDEAEGTKCQQKYGHPGDMLPFVYVVGTNGEKLFSHSGIMESEELRQLLTTQAEKIGKNLSSKELTLLKKAVEDAKRAHTKGDLGAAVKALLTVKKLGPLGNFDSHAKPAVEANKLVAQWTEEGKAVLKEVDQKLSDGNATFEAALAYARAKRTLAPLTTLKADLTAAARKYQRLPDFADTLRQAEALDRAQIAAASSHDTKKAAAAFQRIISTYPDTAAAKLAAEELKKSGDEGGDAAAAPAAKPALRTWTDASGRFTVKARARGVKDGKLSLETEDGSVIQVPLAKLSEADRKSLEPQPAAE